MISTIRGTKDLFGKKYLIYKDVSELFEEKMTNYGFDRLIMPVLEQFDLYDNVGDTSDIVSKEMFIVSHRPAPTDLPFGVVSHRPARSQFQSNLSLCPYCCRYSASISGFYPHITNSNAQYNSTSLFAGELSSYEVDPQLKVVSESLYPFLPFAISQPVSDSTSIGEASYRVSSSGFLGALSELYFSTLFNSSTLPFHNITSGNLVPYYKSNPKFTGLSTGFRHSILYNTLLRAIIDMPQDIYSYTCPYFCQTLLAPEVTSPLRDVTDKKSEEEARTVLRPEGTMSCVRHLINTGQISKNDVRLFYNEKMFRYSRPQRGREREFIQLGCEVFKSDFAHTEAEIISCLYFFIKSLNINFKLCINTTGSRASLSSYVPILQAFLKQKSELLSEANRARLSKNVLRVLDQLSEEEKDALSDGFPSLLDYITPEEKERFSLLCSMLEGLGVEFIVDQFIIRGLDYYEGCIFELVTPEYSIAGGGRYRINKDKLNLDQDIVGFGWAVGYERIAEYVSLEIKKEPLYLVFALGNPSFALEVGSLLRDKLKKKTKLIFGSMKKCLSGAAKLDPDYVVFCGETEERELSLNVKNWRSGEKSISSLEDLKL